MKKIIILILGIFLFTGCTNNQYKGVVNVLNWSSYIPDDVISDFEKEYNIKVHYGTYSSNEELLAKISSSKEGTYDLIFPSDYMIELMKQRELLEPFQKEKLNNLNNINIRFLKQPYDSNNEYSVPFLLATTTIAVNKDSIKDNITSYQDLLNEKYQNNIVLIDDQRIIIGAALQGLGYDINDTNKEHLEEAYNFLMKLKKNVKAFDSDSPKTFLITKEVDIGLIWNAESILAKEENDNIEIIYPEDGYVLSMDNYAIVKGSKNKENAYLLIDYLLRDDICERIIKEYPYISTNKHVGNLSDEEVSVILKNGSYIKNIGEHISDYDKLWARIK
ncbi:MAG: spermidine/putrescine ABC transporter substrate-binding protein [Bacilli bacterium]|nr:spermidine/putrescine ABC transporter substrate-binding protein [Bacilli bacterium]